MMTAKERRVFATLGPTNRSDGNREEHDYYATIPLATELLMEVEKFNHNIWECACGEGHISEVLLANGYDVKNTDLIDRGYGEVEDFLTTNIKFDGDIITNPPYKDALAFCQKAIEVIPIGNKVAMFLKIQFLEGINRRKFFEEHPPKVIYVASKRLNCAKNGDFKKYNSSAICYAWFIWEKGYKGDTIVKWIN